MSAVSAIPFIRRTAKERVDGTLTVSIDIEPMYKLQFLQMFPDMEAPGALTALVKNHPQPKVEVRQKEKIGNLCLLACTFCADPKFSEWAGTHTDEQAKQFILDACLIKSRKELDTCQDAAELFHLLVRKPFMAWKGAK